MPMKQINFSNPKILVDTQFFTHNLILEDGQNDHSYTKKKKKIIVALHALNCPLHIIKMILRF